MNPLAIKIENVVKEYRLGTIGSGTLREDLRNWWTRLRSRDGGGGTQAGVIRALDGVSLEIRKGEVVGIIGRNGAGKSTLLKLLSRVTVPTAGTLSLNGRVSSMLEVGTGFHRELTGRENVYLNGAILGMGKAEIDRKFDAIAAYSGLEAFLDTPVKRYSSGMYVKLAFAVAACLDSDIMILDEVLAVGDQAFQQKCLETMNEKATMQGRTILCVSHNLAMVQQLCARCIVLEKGRILFDGPAEEAVSCYLAHSFPAATVCDMKGIVRPAPCTMQAEFLRVELLETENGVLQRGRPLRFRATWRAREALENLVLKAQVKAQSVIPVGCGAVRLADIAAGEERTQEFELEWNQVVQGGYSLSLELVALLPQGGRASRVDATGEIFRLTIRRNADLLENPFASLPWQHRLWGNLQFPLKAL